MAESEFFQALASGEEQPLQRFLSRTRRSAIDFRNNKGCTALHMLTLTGSTSLLYFLIDEVRKRPQEAGQLKSWVQVRNRDGLTALHYAFYNGKVDSARVFLQLGASLSEKTENGANVLMLAAMGDQALMVAFSEELQVPLGDRDFQGNTALHYAAKEGADFVVNVLLALDHQGLLLNAANSQGQTALMLAAVSGNRRNVRSLLLRGADSELRDSEGLMALNLAKQNGHAEVVRMLTRSWTTVLLGGQPVRPLRWPALPVLVALLLLGIGNSFLFWKTSAFEEVWDWLMSAWGVLTLLVFFLLQVVGPGEVGPKNSVVKLRALYEFNNAEEICPDCVLLRSARCHHCHFCKRCVHKFDHHCPWVANCIGRRNLWLFYLFLMLTWVNVAMISLKAWMCLFLGQGEGGADQVICIMVAVVALFPLAVVGALWFTQTSNCLNGTTTYERFRFRQSSTTSKLSNCLDMCCDIQSGNRDMEDQASTCPSVKEDLVRPLL